MSTQHRLHRALVALGLGLAVTCAGIGSAAAQPGAPGNRGMVNFAGMDRDGDGLVSAEEHALFRAERIAGRAAEGRPLRNAANAPAFTDLDLDHDGWLTPAEVASAWQARQAAGYGPGYGRGSGRGGGYGMGYAAGDRPCPRGN